MSALQWILENKTELITTVTATLTALALIAKLTPSPADDGVVAKILGWLNLIPRSKVK